MSDKDILKIVQARMDGKRIQARKLSGGEWMYGEIVAWDFFLYEYRVAPAKGEN